MKFYFASLLTFYLLTLASCNSKNNNAVIIIDYRSELKDSIDVIVMTTVEGNVFWARRDTFKIANGQKKLIEVPPIECGLLLIRSLNSANRILVTPGDEIGISFGGTGNNSLKVQHSGSNKAGHEYFNSLRRATVLEIPNQYIKDSSTIITALKDTILHQSNTEKLYFDSLLASGKISRYYYQGIIQEIRYYYKAMEADVVTNKYYLDVLDVNKSGDSLRQLSHDYLKWWDRIFDTATLFNPGALKTEYYRSFALLYYKWYVGSYLEITGRISSLDPGLSALSDIRGEHLKNTFLIKVLFKNKAIKEYLLATYFYYNIYDKTNADQLISIFTSFNNDYPRSLYISYIKNYFNDLKAFQNTVTTVSNGIKFLTNYRQIDSFDGLLFHLKGRKYYIDIWDTYCAPCIEEFSHHKELKKMLDERQISILFLSVDKDNRESVWQKMIRYYKLDGLHVRANTRLTNNIMKKLAKNGIFYLPRYILVGKSGKVDNIDMNRPSEIDIIREHLDSTEAKL